LKLGFGTHLVPPLAVTWAVFDQSCCVVPQSLKANGTMICPQLFQYASFPVRYLSSPSLSSLYSLKYH